MLALNDATSPSGSCRRHIIKADDAQWLVKSDAAVYEVDGALKRRLVAAPQSPHGSYACCWSNAHSQPRSFDRLKNVTTGSPISHTLHDPSPLPLTQLINVWPSWCLVSG